MKIWIDADACPKPIKEIVYKASERTEVEVSVVANSYLNVPENGLVTFIQVSQGMDVADQHIYDEVNEGDLVITQDIPLAAKVCEKGATAIDPRGEILSEENVSERLSMRNFMTGLRDTGTITGGPKAFSKKDKENFAKSFDKVFTQLLRK